MARYRHWENRGKPGETVFVTATALDFADVFREDSAKDLVVQILFADHERYGALLHAYVVMRNHLHFLTDLPASHDVSWFVQRVKSNIARAIRPTLSSVVTGQLAIQTGLGGRTFWQRSFRSVVVEGNRVFWQKVGYIHENPVRARLVADASDYRWSSAGLYGRGCWLESQGLRRE